MLSKLAARQITVSGMLSVQGICAHSVFGKEFDDDCEASHFSHFWLFLRWNNNL